MFKKDIKIGKGIYFNNKMPANICGSITEVCENYFKVEFALGFGEETITKEEYGKLDYSTYDKLK